VPTEVDIGRRGTVASVPDQGFAPAVVEGFEVDRDAADPEAGAALRSLLAERALLCLRQPAKLTDEQLQAIVTVFGEVKDPVGLDVDGQPLRYSEPRQVIDSGFVMTDELREQLGGGSLGGDDARPGLFEHFHTDDSYVHEPAAATVLHARELPSGPGGATSFVDMRVAYEQLPVDERADLLGLRARHAYNNHDAFPPRASASGPLERLAPVAHPVVRAHPVTGVPALYFDLDRACGIDGMPDDEGRPLLQRLQDLAEQHAPRYDHRWQPHDVLVWDNAAVQHKASGDFPLGEPRRFWRYMVAGTVPLAYQPG
jgi:alpha-ketoglutarate-dependent taurine dioxygenase